MPIATARALRHAQKSARRPTWPSLQIAMTAAQQVDGNSLFLQRAAARDVAARDAGAMIISRA